MYLFDSDEIERFEKKWAENPSPVARTQIVEMEERQDLPGAFKCDRDSGRGHLYFWAPSAGVTGSADILILSEMYFSSGSWRPNGKQLSLAIFLYQKGDLRLTVQGRQSRGLMSHLKPDWGRWLPKLCGGWQGSVPCGLLTEDLSFLWLLT